MDIKATRLQNLKLAVTIAGSTKDLAEKSGTPASYISQCLSENIDKSLGPSVARRIENALGFEKYWMDTIHEAVDIEEERTKSPIPSLYLLLDQLSEEEKEDMSEIVYMMIRKRKILKKYE